MTCLILPSLPPAAPPGEDGGYLLVATGAGGTAIAAWLYEILLYAEEILGLILLPIMAGAVYLLDILMFQSRMPRREDMESPNGKGSTQ